MSSAARQLLDAYIAAELKILAGQSYQIDGRRLQLANLAEVQAERRRLERVVADEEAAARGGGSRFAQADFSGRQGAGDWGRD
ncbi:hypothetical protein CO615_10440 [Lysobacteraceae bacterium NML75-0749]|nr:hypothetical protein CO615_10440 [Xanthomonadaceae bacterium NML75-0749]